MGAARFEGVDILDSLGQIMELHTQHYKDDFDMDKELIQNLVLSGEPEDRRLLWMSRPCGTYTLREWEVYLEGSHANKVWRFYHEQTKDPILAYALSVKDVKDGRGAWRSLALPTSPLTFGRWRWTATLFTLTWAIFRKWCASFVSVPIT